jgi:hypothetical protein
MSRLSIALSLVAACHSTSEKPPDTPASVAAVPAGSATSPAMVPHPAPDGRDLPAPLYAGMFVDGATFEYTLHAYKVEKLGERHATKDDEKRVKCHIHDLVFMHELKALSARLTCDVRGPLNGVMFAASGGFWWYDEQRYLAGGFVMDESTKVFGRTPKESGYSDQRLSSVERDKDGAWCWSESFDRPWTSQGLCFANGQLVSGWAANEATAKANGDYVEFKLATK